MEPSGGGGDPEGWAEAEERFHGLISHVSHFAHQWARLFWWRCHVNRERLGNDQKPSFMLAG